MLDDHVDGWALGLREQAKYERRDGHEQRSQLTHYLQCCLLCDSMFCLVSNPAGLVLHSHCLLPKWLTNAPPIVSTVALSMTSI